MCSLVIILSSSELQQVFSFPLYASKWWLPWKGPTLTMWPETSASLLFLFICHLTEVAVMFKCRTTMNTLVEILSALHLALFLCSVWSQACTILWWIFSSEESSIKGALIIHDARFRFVPHCSETENSPLCYFAEEQWISFF